MGRYRSLLSLLLDCFALITPLFSLVYFLSSFSEKVTIDQNDNESHTLQYEYNGAFMVLLFVCLNLFLIYMWCFVYLYDNPKFYGIVWLDFPGINSVDFYIVLFNWFVLIVPSLNLLYMFFIYIKKRVYCKN